VPEVIAEGGVWSQQRVTGKMPGKEVGAQEERRTSSVERSHAQRLRFRPLVLELP